MLLASFAACLSLLQSVPEEAQSAFPFGPREAEHLLNRAGFGATQAEIASWVALGLEGAVERLLEPPLGAPVPEDIAPTLARWEDFGFTHRQGVIPDSPWFKKNYEERMAIYNEERVRERSQFFEMERRFFDAALAGHDPLRLRMLLFWHGFFTTSGEVYKRKFEIVSQFQWLQRHALSSYASLLRGIVRAPGMLNYLDNTSNFRERPNENLARELMEIYTLGEGHFSELDVREAARALTGHAGGSDGHYEFLPDEHDGGEKVFLGVRGQLDASDLVEILLAQEACPRYVARRLVQHFEGLDPDPERLEEYATCLREGGFEIRPFLRRLFLDPRFYRDEVVGTRVVPPIELLVAASRRLGARPTVEFLHLGGFSMGQSFYMPPTVKGWPEGLGWLDGDAIFRRGNVLGVLCGGIDPDDDGLPHELAAMLTALGCGAWQPAEQLLPALRLDPPADGAALARRLAEEWLAAQPPQETLDWIEAEIASAVATGPGTLSDLLRDNAAAERFLRRLAHLVLSLPEGQLS